MIKKDARTKEQPVEKGVRSMTESSNTIPPRLLVTVREETVTMMVDTGATNC